MSEELIIPASIIALFAVGGVIAFVSNRLGTLVSCRITEADIIRPGRKKPGVNKS